MTPPDTKAPASPAAAPAPKPGEPQHTLPPPSSTERIAYALLALLARLPLGVWRALGAVLGWLIYALLDLSRKRKRVADVNLQLCFPELNAAQRRHIIRQHCVRLVQSLFDRIWLWHGSPTLLQRRIRLVGDSTALLAPKPTILFAPHFLGMDAGGMLMVPLLSDRACVTIYSPQRNAAMDRWVRRGRSRFPNSLPLWKGGGIKPIIAALRQGGMLYLLPDMNFGAEESIFVNFFGHPAATIPSLARFAKLGRAQVITAVTYMEPHGYTVHLSEPWSNFPTNDVHADTQRMNTHLEDWVRQRPAEYFWLHKRFKTRPSGEPPVY